MNYFQLRATLLSPLMVQENRQSNAPVCLHYLPGSSLRGAIAAQYLRCGGKPEDEAFQSVFVSEPVMFPDLLPTNDHDQLSYPLPLTSFSCKRSPGFRKEYGHGIGDSLAVLLASSLEERNLTEAFSCPVCRQDMKSFRGFWNGSSNLPRKNGSVVVFQRHTGIDRLTGTAASSVFYNSQGISEYWKNDKGEYVQQLLTGGLYLNDRQYDLMLELLQQPIFVGADRTRGMGEMKVEITPFPKPEFDIIEWDRRFREKVTALTSKNLPPGFYFSVGLSSHTILVDPFLRSSCDLQIDFPDIVPVIRIIDQTTIRGWHSCWKLPKPEESALMMGSVFLFLYTGKDVDKLYSFVKKISLAGIGLRRAEGFGRLMVCDHLHIQEDLI